MFFPININVKFTFYLYDYLLKFRLDSSPEATQNLSLIRPRYIGVVRKGAISSLERGPKVGGIVMDTQIILHDLKIGRGTADSFVMAAAGQCVQKVIFLKKEFLFFLLTKTF